MAKFDLTCRIGQYLDRHLVLPHLEFLSARGVSFYDTWLPTPMWTLKFC